MVLDRIENYKTYVGLHPSFEKVFEYICNTDFLDLPVGKITFEDTSFYINLDEAVLKKKTKPFLKHMIDILIFKFL